MVKSKPNTAQNSNKKVIAKKKGEASLAKRKGENEIDALFASKKAKKKEESIEKQKQKNIHKSNKRSNVINKSLNGDRSDIDNMKKCEWVDDGLGGVFDKDGFTGRKEQRSGFKIYKAHLMNKKGFGQTKDCPFDCDCCYI